MKPFIIPFFIPHEGCPHACVFCDQHRSGGRRKDAVTPESVGRGIEAGLSSGSRRLGAPVEVAFFGGTFTALPAWRQEELLGAARPFLASGRVSSLRVSTRPDAVDDQRLERLKQYGVGTVEIGAQSMDDRVLRAAGRGHCAEDTRRAADRVREAGLRLGLQLMIGLPGEDARARRTTIEQAMEIRPEDARLYPLLVIQGTRLADLFERGRYRPLTLDAAVDLTAAYYRRLTGLGVRVIRMGLQTEKRLEENLLAGPYHPAFGERVLSRVHGQAMATALRERPAADASPVIHVSPGDLSRAVGHRKSNLPRLRAAAGSDILEIRPDHSLAAGRFRWLEREYDVGGRVSSRERPHSWRQNEG